MTINIPLTITSIRPYTNSNRLFRKCNTDINVIDAILE